MSSPSRVGNICFYLWLAALHILLFMRIASKGPIQYPDSASYLSSSLYRPPLYPVILSVFESLFGESALHAVVFFQAAFGSFAVWALSRFLQTRFHLKYLTTALCHFILISPYFTHNVISPRLNIANNIMTEAISYALFLLALRYLLSALLDLRARDFAIYIIIITLAISARNQFLFVHSVSFLSVVYIGFYKKNLRRFSFGAALIIASISISFLFERIYNYHNHGEFSKTPFAEYQLIAGAFYVSEKGNADLFVGKNHAFFLDIYSEITKKKALLAMHPERGALIFGIEHFRMNYNNIVWGTVRPAVFRIFSRENGATSEPLVAAAPHLRAVTRLLIWNNLTEYVRLYLSNLLSHVKPHEGIVILAALAATLSSSLRRSGNAQLALAVALALHISNCALIALVEPVLRRYTFYTDITYPVFFIIFFSTFISAESTSGGPASENSGLPEGKRVPECVG